GPPAFGLRRGWHQEDRQHGEHWSEQCCPSPHPKDVDIQIRDGGPAKERRKRVWPSERQCEKNCEEHQRNSQNAGKMQLVAKRTERPAVIRGVKPVREQRHATGKDHNRQSKCYRVTLEHRSSSGLSLHPGSRQWARASGRQKIADLLGVLSLRRLRHPVCPVLDTAEASELR